MSLRLATSKARALLAKKIMLKSQNLNQLCLLRGHEELTEEHTNSGGLFIVLKDLSSTDIEKPSNDNTGLCGLI